MTTGAIWQATDWGVELDGYGLPIERVSEVRKGRYVAIKEVASRFFGEENDVGFIRAFREAMQIHAKPIDDLAFRRTIKEIVRMRSHRFVYRIAENVLHPCDDNDESPDRYFKRTRDPRFPQIEEYTKEIFRTSSSLEA